MHRFLRKAHNDWTMAVSYTHLVKTKAYVDLQRIAREVINRIGYTKSEYMFEGNSCGVFSACLLYTSRCV